MPSLHDVVRKARNIPLPNVGVKRVPKRWRFNECGHDRFERTCRQCTNVRVEGVASSGEMSSKGVVAHRERWDDSEDALVVPSPIIMSLAVQQRRGIWLPWQKR